MATSGSADFSKELPALLEREERHIIASWVGLLRTTMPQLFATMDASTWAGRVIDVLNTLQLDLKQPENLTFPVLSPRKDTERLLALGRRVVPADTIASLDLHDLVSAYYLLEQALYDVVGNAWPEALHGTGENLIGNFFKQLLAGMSMAITAQRTAALELAVEERTRSLRERIAKEYELTNALSHHIRTLLTTVLGACDVMLDVSHEPLTISQRRYVGLIMQSGELMLGLVNDMQDFARLDLGHAHLEKHAIDLGAIAPEAIAEERTKWAEREIRFLLELPPDLPPIAGDPARVRQIIRSLLANAARFSPKGGRVILRATRSMDAVDLEVLTPDAALPEPERARIVARIRELERYMQPGISEGLGLPLVRLLADLQGGRLEVSARPEDGQLIKMSLPLAEAS